MTRTLHSLLLAGVLLAAHVCMAGDQMRSASLVTNGFLSTWMAVKGEPDWSPTVTNATFGVAYRVAFVTRECTALGTNGVAVSISYAHRSADGVTELELPGIFEVMLEIRNIGTQDVRFFSYTSGEGLGLLPCKFFADDKLLGTGPTVGDVAATNLAFLLAPGKVVRERVHAFCWVAEPGIKNITMEFYALTAERSRYSDADLKVLRTLPEKIRFTRKKEIAQPSAPAAGALGEDSQLLRVGSWVNEGPRNILGAGVSRVVTLSRSNAEWMIAFTSIHYPSVNDRAAPTKETRGPFPVTVSEGILSYQDGGRAIGYSYSFRTNGLMLPSFIKVDDRTWRFRSPGAEGVFRCEFDPFITPVGRAEFPTTAPVEHPRYYVYERGPHIQPQNARARQLRFMVRMPDGSLHGDPVFIWDESGQPRFEGSSWYHDFKESLYTPLEHRQK